MAPLRWMPRFYPKSYSTKNHQNKTPLLHCWDGSGFLESSAFFFKIIFSFLGFRCCHDVFEARPLRMARFMVVLLNVFITRSMGWVFLTTIEVEFMRRMISMKSSFRASCMLGSRVGHKVCTVFFPKKESVRTIAGLQALMHKSS